MNLKQIWKAALAIALAAAILVGLSAALRTVDAQKDLEEQELAMSYLLMDGAPFTEETVDSADESITAAYKGTNGYIVEVTVDGYAAPMTLWVGVKNDGYVTGLTVRDMDETYGLGREAMFDVAVGENIDAMTGATVSSRAVTKAVNAAVAYVTGADVSSSATEWGG